MPHGVAAQVIHPGGVAFRLEVVAVRLGVAFDFQVAVFVGQHLPQVEEIAVLFQRNGGQLIVDVAQAVAVQALVALCAATSGRTGVMDCT